MRDFLEQVRRASEANLYYLALAGALVVPDMCAAMDAEDGVTNRDRYVKWFDDNAAWRFSPPNGDPIVSGADCYGLRCSMLHQGRLSPHRSDYSRVVFVEPGRGGLTLHLNVLEDALNLDIPSFVDALVRSSMEWLDRVENTSLYQSNYGKTMQRYPDGLSPYIVGIPVIA